jgi:uncharacterized protein (DUF169 family)
MDMQFKSYFSVRWEKYFVSAELPITYFYTDQPSEADLEESTRQGRCLICNLNPVREGRSFVYSADTPGCTGGKRYTGFSQTLRPNFEYFLSCGIPGELEGERYKKTPELVEEHLQRNPPFQAPAEYLVFKRWDRLMEEDQPVAVVFFATPDVLSGLFTLANYDYANTDGVIAPMGSGCASIFNYPYLESASATPRCVLGMFDVSARPCVPEEVLTFTVPMRRFEQMVANMDESFLITKSWNEVRERLL